MKLSHNRGIIQLTKSYGKQESHKRKKSQKR